MFGLPLRTVAQSGSALSARLMERQHTYAFGAHLHEQGLGLDFMYFNKGAKKTETVWALSLASLKDRRENRMQTIYQSQGGKSFIYDKINYAYLLSALYGKNRIFVMLDKFNRLQLRTGFYLGPTIAILKPYFIEIAEPIGGPQNLARIYVGTYNHKDPKTSYNNIVGQADFFSNFGGMSVVPGLSARANLIVNFTSTNSLFKGLNMGVKADIFLQPLEIMDRKDDFRFFAYSYIGFLFGHSTN
jgi:hypothetical protein